MAADDSSVAGLDDFLRISAPRDWSSVLVEPRAGGTGRGVELSSPMRRRVRVSWALVGTPLRRVLHGQRVLHFISRGSGVLFKIEVFLPVGDLGVEQGDCPGDDGVAEEGSPGDQGDGLDDHMAGEQEGDQEYCEQDPGDLQARAEESEWG